MLLGVSFLMEGGDGGLGLGPAAPWTQTGSDARTVSRSPENPRRPAGLGSLPASGTAAGGSRGAAGGPALAARLPLDSQATQHCATTSLRRMKCYPSYSLTAKPGLQYSKPYKKNERGIRSVISTLLRFNIK